MSQISIIQDHHKLRETYLNKTKELNSEIDVLSKKHFRYSVFRLIVFILGIGLSIWSWSLGALFFILITLGWIISFLYCIYSQFRIDKRRSYKEALQKINQNEGHIIDGQNSLYYDGQDYEIRHHSYASDLDLFGSFSLYRKLNRCRSFKGQELLANWISTPSKTHEIYKRQTLVKELSEELEFRQDVAAHLWDLDNQHSSNPLPAINAGLEGDYLFASWTPLRMYRMVLPFIWISIAITYYYESNIGYISLLLVGLLNFIISLRYANQVSEIQSKLSGSILKLGTYANALTSILDRSWKDTYLEEMIEPLRSNQEPKVSIASIKRLQQLMDLLDFRLSMIPSLLLNIGLLWDSRIVYKIKLWKDQNPNIFSQVFEIIGHVEAINALATWSYNHPSYNYPEVNDDHFNLEAVELLHPLMPIDTAVPNNFGIHKGEFVSIITGSNMSGKSTLLRTIGINMILAYAGAKIAGHSLSFSNAKLVTYMRIKDALEENASTFKAELDRVGLILRLMKSGEPCFILIDEMLRGTNSKDKLKGSIAFTNEVLATSSYAMIATHDIQLTELSKSHPKKIRNYYFDIDYKNNELVFDYSVKSGICENFNASYLLAKMGLNLG
ncbi:MAG: ABC-type multidrug transport system fused ATPase/permease subunit [Saprospiraceae bacterium]|jgi:ABC-type multidrug transport system fused ATPase/permease subunit